MVSKGLEGAQTWWKDGVLGARQSAESEALVGEVARGGQRRSVSHERYIKEIYGVSLKTHADPNFKEQLFTI